MTAADHYRAIYTTLFRMNERHDLRAKRRAANLNETPRLFIGADQLDRQGASQLPRPLSVLFDQPPHATADSPKGQLDRV